MQNEIRLLTVWDWGSDDKLKSGSDLTKIEVQELEAIIIENLLKQAERKYHQRVQQ
jgi:hypothetical protein